MFERPRGLVWTDALAVMSPAKPFFFILLLGLD